MTTPSKQLFQGNGLIKTLIKANLKKINYFLWILLIQRINIFFNWLCWQVIRKEFNSVALSTMIYLERIFACVYVGVHACVCVYTYTYFNRYCFSSYCEHIFYIQIISTQCAIRKKPYKREMIGFSLLLQINALNILISTHQIKRW